MFAKSLFSEICTQKARFPKLGPSWGASAGPEGVAVRVRRSASRCQSRTGLKVEPKSKRSQSRSGVPCLKVEWFCAKKPPAKSNWVCIMHFCFMIQVYTPWFWPFCMDICFNRWFLDWTIIRVDGSFLMMTASCSRYSLLSFPLLGFIPLYFPAFLGFTAAFNRHFRAGFRLYYGI